VFTDGTFYMLHNGAKKEYKQINKHKKHLFNYLLFLRLTPLLPNWFINISSPVLGVPYSYFCLATFFGIMPASFIAVKAGLTLQGYLDCFLNVHPTRELFVDSPFLSLSYRNQISKRCVQHECYSNHVRTGTDHNATHLEAIPKRSR